MLSVVYCLLVNRQWMRTWQFWQKQCGTMLPWSLKSWHSVLVMSLRCLIQWTETGGGAQDVKTVAGFLQHLLGSVLVCLVTHLTKMCFFLAVDSSLWRQRSHMMLYFIMWKWYFCFSVNLNAPKNNTCFPLLISHTC